ncbi:hypothetical protein [Rossellomorea sp. y25]|uniref:hypothetical protein n=1 Tax=Rossellomorea sp. y25 TaxID=3118174 RepID=UPI0030DE9288
MNCYYHHGTAGSASCHECGRTLCSSCSDRFNPILCEGCFTSSQSSERKEIVKKFTISGILLFIGMIFSIGSGSLGTAIISTYFIAAIPFGWTLISRILSGWVLFMGIRGWIIYPFAKLLASWVIGGFVAPFYLYKMIKRFKEINNDMNTVIQENADLKAGA